MSQEEQYAIAQHFLVPSLHISERAGHRDSNYPIKVSRLARYDLLVHGTLLYDISSWPPRLVPLFGDLIDGDALCQQHPSGFSNSCHSDPFLLKGPNVIMDAWMALQVEPESVLSAEERKCARDEEIRCSAEDSYPVAGAYTAPSPSPANFNQDAKIRLVTQLIWVDENDMRQCHERVWGFDHPFHETTGYEVLLLGQQTRFSQKQVKVIGILGGRLLIASANMMFLEELHGGQFRYLPSPVDCPLLCNSNPTCACILIPPRFPGVLEDYGLVHNGQSSRMFLWEEGVFKEVTIVSDEPSVIPAFLTQSHVRSFDGLDHERFLTLPSSRTFYVILGRLVEAFWETSSSDTPILRLVNHATWLPYKLKYIVGMVLRDGQEALFLPGSVIQDDPVGCVYHVPPRDQQWPKADTACFRIIRTGQVVRWRTHRISFSQSCQHFVFWHCATGAKPVEEKKSEDVVMHIDPNFVPSPPSTFGNAGAAVGNVPWATIEAMPLMKASEWVDLDAFLKDSTFGEFQSVCPHELMSAVWTRKEPGLKDRDFYCANSRSKYLWLPRLPAYCYHVVAGIGKVPKELQAPEMRVLMSTADLADFLGASMWYKDTSSVPSGGVLTDFSNQKRSATQLEDMIKNGSRGGLTLEIEGLSKPNNSWGGPLAWLGIVDVKPSVVKYLSSLSDLSVFKTPAERNHWDLARNKRKAPVNEASSSKAPEFKFVRFEWLRGNNYRNNPPLVLHGYVDKVQHLDATHIAVSTQELTRNIFIERELPAEFHTVMSQQSEDGEGKRAALPVKELANLLNVAIPIEENKAASCYRQRQQEERSSDVGLGQGALWVWIMEQQLHDIHGTHGPTKRSPWSLEEEDSEVPEPPFEGHEQELLDPATLSDHFLTNKDITELRFSPCLVLRRFTLAEIISIVPVLPSSLPSGPSFVELLQVKPQGTGFAIGLQEHLHVDPLIAAKVSPSARDLPQAVSLARIQWIKQYADDAPFVKPIIYRVRGDTLCAGGDDDASLDNTMVLDFPLYVCDHLPLEYQKRKQLLVELARVGDLTRDFHEREPLQDLIDPNLCPRLIEQKEASQLDKPTQASNSEVSIDAEDGSEGAKPVRMEDEEEKAEEDEETEEGKNKATETYLQQQRELRKQYHWIPTEVFVSKEGRVSFQSGIHYSLPRDTNQSLYESLEATFAAMVPLFRELGALPNGCEAAPYYESISESTGFSKAVAGLVCDYLSIRFLVDAHRQVIIKAQQYLMPKGSSYAGKWHLEGLTENIQAVGAYYPLVDPGLRGGDIRFRNQLVAAHDSENFVSTVEVQTGEGVALVWANTLPHRVRKVDHDYERKPSNVDDDEANFDDDLEVFDFDEAEEADAKQEDGGIGETFFGQPKAKKTKETPSSISSTNTKLLRIFVNFFIVDPQKPLPTLATCPQHPLDQWKNPEVDGKLFRERVRNVMGKTAAGWGFGGYGNCGLYRARLVGAGDEDSENFHRTDSDRDQNQYVDFTWGL